MAVSLRNRDQITEKNDAEEKLQDNGLGGIVAFADIEVFPDNAKPHVACRKNL